jgi:hypothetical protein
MRKRRTLDEIADEAVAVINPPAESKAACRALVMGRLEMISGLRFHVPRHRPTITSLEGYAKALRAAKAKAAAAYAADPFLRRARRQSPTPPSSPPVEPDVPISGIQLSDWVHRKAHDRTDFDEHGDVELNFIDVLDDELKRAEQRCELVRDIANCSPQKGHPLPDLCAVWAVQEALNLIDRDCPWRRRPTLTATGPWLRLSSLLYEANTGKVEHDLSRYCREWGPLNYILTFDC